MTEHWVAIEGFNGLYEVSSEGRVRSLFDNRRNARIFPKILKPGLVHGYHQYVLMKHGKRHNLKAHAAVLRAFVGPRPEHMEARHLNGCRTDNRVSNLLWGTQKENALDRVQHGSCAGERNARAKLTEQAVAAIRLRYAASDVTHKQLAAEYGVARCVISFAIARTTWPKVL